MAKKSSGPRRTRTAAGMQTIEKTGGEHVDDPVDELDDVDGPEEDAQGNLIEEEPPAPLTLEREVMATSFEVIAEHVLLPHMFEAIMKRVLTVHGPAGVEEFCQYVERKRPVLRGPLMLIRRNLLAIIRRENGSLLRGEDD